MRRVFFSPDPEAPSREPPPLGPDDLESMIQDTVAILADIDAVYDARRREVAETSLTVPRRTTLLTQLDARYRKDREPHVQLLAELHGRIMGLTLFRTEHCDPRKSPAPGRARAGRSGSRNYGG